MTRVLKFRAWFIRDKRMVYNWHEMTPGDHSYAVYPAVTLEGKFIGKSIYDNVGAIPLEKHWWIFMQFTGLLDKNGKEIYEGDIVRNDVCPSPEITVISWKDGGFTYDNTRYDSDGLLYPKEWEVIGNIYENPDLLNGPQAA